MDKGRHPKVVRTWIVERIGVPDRKSQPAKQRSVARQKPFRKPKKKS